MSGLELELKYLTDYEWYRFVGGFMYGSARRSAHKKLLWIYLL